MTVLREWGRIGCVGFGGPPVHIALLRELCVDHRGWLHAEDFEDAIATTNLLPGPASTQLAIFCAWRVRRVSGALVGGLAFIGPGLVLIVGLAALFLASSPPVWIRGAGAGAGAAVPAIAIQAGLGLLPASSRRAHAGRRARWIIYLLAGALSAATIGPWLVLVLLGCGLSEIVWQRAANMRSTVNTHGWPALAAVAASAGGLGALAWTALKVGALSYGGGFVIIPLMQADAVDRHGWMTDGQFLNAVALGQVTPGPVTHTVAAVGFAAAGVGGALLAAAIAFAPSFCFVLLGAARFDVIRASATVRAFLDGAGPAAIGAILGASIPLALALTETWQAPLLVAAALALLVLRTGVVIALMTAGAIGVTLALLGASLPT